MEATFSLRQPRAPVTNPHCLFTAHRNLLTVHKKISASPARYTTLYSIQLPASTSSSSSSATKQRFHQLVCAQQVSQPPPDAGNGRVRSAVAVGAAVVLACFAGIMCSKLKHGGSAKASPLGWTMGRPPAASRSPSPTQGPEGPERTVQQKSLDVLSAIFERNSGGVDNTPTLRSLISHHIVENKLKNYPNLLDLSGRQAADLLQKEPEKWPKWIGHEEQYESGLLLMDVFINLGDYQKADNINMKGSTSDIRYRLRKFIIKVMLAMDATLKDPFTEETDEAQKKMIYEMILQLLEYNKKTSGPPLET